MTEQSHEPPGRTIYCCSGASNVGVLSFMAAIRLSQEGYGSLACIAGIGSRNQPMIRAQRWRENGSSSTAARSVAERRSWKRTGSRSTRMSLSRNWG